MVECFLVSDMIGCVVYGEFGGGVGSPGSDNQPYCPVEDNRQ